MEALLEHTDWVDALARRISSDPELAADAVQQTWLAGVQATPGQVSRNWLACVLRNAVRKLRRGEGRRRRREECSAQPEAVEGTIALALKVQRQRAVLKAVLDLEEPLRSTLLLRYWEGCTPPDIARRLGVPLNTVRSRLVTAHRCLRRRLEGLQPQRQNSWLAMLFPLGPSFWSSWKVAGMSLSMKVGVAFVFFGALGGYVWWQGSESPGPEPALAQRAALPSLAQTVPAVPKNAALAKRLEEAPAVEPNPIEIPAESVQAASAMASVRGRQVIGQVLGPDAEPKAGIAVVRSHRNPDDQQPSVSDAEGYFEMQIDDLNEIWLVASDPQYMTLLQGQVKPQATIDPVVVVAQVRQVEGAVVDESGRGLRGAQVRVELPAYFRSRFRTILEASSNRTWIATTEEYGEFVLSGTPSMDQARIEVSCTGFETLALILGDLQLPGCRIVLQRLEAQPNILIGQVIDHVGLAVEEAWVALGDASTRTDAQGIFHLELEEAEGAMELRAVKRGHLPVQLEVPNPPDLWSGWADPLTLQLGSEPLTITGHIVDGEGEPLRFAMIHVKNRTPFGHTEEDFQTYEDVLGGERFDTSSDEHGAFRLEGLLPQDYELLAIHPRSLVTETFGPFAAGTHNVVVTLQEADCYQPFAGRVLDRHGLPVVGVRVYGSFQGISVGSTNTHTDEEGRFQFDKFARQGVHVGVYGDAVMHHHYALPDQHPKEHIITVSRRCHFRVEAHPEFEATHIQAFDENGEPLTLAQRQGNVTHTSNRAAFTEGKTAVLAVSDAAVTLVVWNAEKQVSNHALNLAAEELSVLRVD
jgi:RNA polymerase sigma-70 factor (ECF subfamily)